LEDPFPKKGPVNIRAEVAPFAIPIVRESCREYRPRCRGFSTVEQPACSATNVVFDVGFIEEGSPVSKTAGLSETTAPILVVIVAVAMAYVLWRVFMKKYSKVRLGIRNLPVSSPRSRRIHFFLSSTRPHFRLFPLLPFLHPRYVCISLNAKNVESARDESKHLLYVRAAPR